VESSAPAELIGVLRVGLGRDINRIRKPCGGSQGFASRSFGSFDSTLQVPVVRTAQTVKLTAASNSWREIAIATSDDVRWSQRAD
jgi:hypothetical protein